MAPHLKVPLALKPIMDNKSFRVGMSTFGVGRALVSHCWGPGLISQTWLRLDWGFFFRSGSPPWGFLRASWFSYLDQKKKKKNQLNFQLNLEKSRRKASSVMYHSCDPIYFDLIYSKCSETWKLAS